MCVGVGGWIEISCVILTPSLVIDESFCISDLFDKIYHYIEIRSMISWIVIMLLSILQYEPKKICPPGGSRQAPLSAGVSFCLQTGVSGALLTPQYGTPSMRADGN